MVEPVYNNPKTRRRSQELLKEIYPQLEIQDYEIQKQIDDRLNAVQKERDEEKAAAKQKAEDDAWKAQRAKVQKEYGFTDEAMTDLEREMKERYIGDYEVAATYRAAKNPAVSEPSYDSQHWHHERAPGWAEIAKDPEAWGRTEILSAIRRGQERIRQG